MPTVRNNLLFVKVFCGILCQTPCLDQLLLLLSEGFSSYHLLYCCADRSTLAIIVRCGSAKSLFLSIKETSWDKLQYCYYFCLGRCTRTILQNSKKKTNTNEKGNTYHKFESKNTRLQGKTRCTKRSRRLFTIIYLLTPHF